MEMREIIRPQLKRGLWKPEEDMILKNYIQTHGEGNWATVSKRSGLMRGGKSCRLRWKNYLRPNIKRGEMSEEEEDLIIRMHKLLGNRWSLIAGRLPGRTDNEVKNYWNTHLNKKCLLGKRKATDSTNSPDANNPEVDKRQRFSDFPPPTRNICQVFQGKNEPREEKTNVDCINYDVKSPLLHLENSIFAFNDEPVLPANWDSFLLFEGLGCSGEGTFGEFLHGF